MEIYMLTVSWITSVEDSTQTIDTSVCEGSKVPLYFLTTDSIISFEWQDDLSIATIETPMSIKGQYQTSNYNCNIRTVINFNLIDNKDSCSISVFIPNAIIYNRSTELKPIITNSHLVDNYTFNIFNHHGAIIYQKSDAISNSIGWSLEINSNNTTDVYLYIIAINDVLGGYQAFTGNITKFR